MPIQRIHSDDREPSVDVFQVQEAVEVYDGVLALAIDHLLNHIKVLVSVTYIPGTASLNKALERHPLLKAIGSESDDKVTGTVNGKTPDRVLLKECQHLLEGLVEIAHLAAWPETQEQAQLELDLLQREVPFLDYRYENDPFRSDKDHEEPNE
jgi:hypothetical protein